MKLLYVATISLAMNVFIIPNSSADFFNDLKAKVTEIQKEAKSLGKDINSSDNKSTSPAPAPAPAKSISSNSTTEEKNIKPLNNSSLGAGSHAGMSSADAKNACSDIPPGNNNSMCYTCLWSPNLIGNPACKDYTHLYVAPVKVKEIIDPADIDKKATELKNYCNSLHPNRKILNCQCWGKEYRALRAKGINNAHYNLSDISNACVATDKIEQFQYLQCVVHAGMWNKIEDFKSYCSCVSNYIATETKKGWAVGATPKTLRLPARKACGYAQQKRLSPEAAKERFKIYGGRNPPQDPAAR